MPRAVTSKAHKFPSHFGRLGSRSFAARLQAFETTWKENWPQNPKIKWMMIIPNIWQCNAVGAPIFRCFVMFFDRLCLSRVTPLSSWYSSISSALLVLISCVAICFVFLSSFKKNKQGAEVGPISSVPHSFLLSSKQIISRTHGKQQQINICIFIWLPVVPHKAVAEVSKTGNL